MLYFIIAFVLALNSGQSVALVDWQPVAPGNQLYDTGDCITYPGGEPFYWTASEQCYDGSQQIARATIRANLASFAPRGATSIIISMSGKFQQVKLFIGQSVQIVRTQDTVQFTIPVAKDVVLQVSEFDGLPAEIYRIDLQYN